MGVFDDKKFEQLDWMTQITETIESELNGLLARMPDRIEFDAKSLVEYVDSHVAYLQVSSVVRNFVNTQGNKEFSWNEIHKLESCFKFEMSPDLELDLESGRMIGTLALIKVIPTIPDEELQPLMGVRGVEAINNIEFEDKWPLDRLNEMLDVLGQCEEAQRGRSHRKKLSRIQERLREIFSTNEWRIRDMSLADKVSHWIINYINTGNLASLTNLCKLKVMTHNNMPIYSVEEEK